MQVINDRVKGCYEEYCSLGSILVHTYVIVLLSLLDERVLVGRGIAATSNTPFNNNCVASGPTA